MDVRPLYNNGAVPLGALTDSIIINGAGAERYAGIPRIQDVLKQLGIVRLRLVKAGLDSAFASRGPDEHILLRVHPEFTVRRLRARGFRSDHFVLASHADGQYELYNDIPALSLLLSSAEMEEAYGGEYFTLRFLRPLVDSDRLWLTCNRCYKVEDSEPHRFDPGMFSGINGFGHRMSQLLRVYKTLRRRMAEYHGMYMDTAFMPLHDIDLLQAQTEYLLLKGKGEPGILYPMFRQLAETDNLLMRICKMKWEARTNE